MSARLVLVINSGSSSLKFQLVDPDSGTALSTGLVERIGEAGSPVADHDAALRRAFDTLADDGIDLKTCGVGAVGHRVVHGGNTFYDPTLLDDAVIARLGELSNLAPLHNPPALKGIEVARRLLPDIPHIAVFDTGFFHDLPPAPRPTPSTATWRSGIRSAGTGSTAPRTATSVSRPPPSWTARPAT